MSEKKPLKEAFARTIKVLGRIGVPALASAIPGGPIIGAVLGGLLGVDGKDDDAMAVALENADPATIAKIKEIEGNLDIRELESIDHEAAQVTERWRADSSSGYWLPNNIRPLALATGIVFWIVWNLIAAAVVSFFFWRSSAVDDALTGFFVNIGLQIAGVVVPMIVAYFGARSYDKKIAKL